MPPDFDAPPDPLLRLKLALQRLADEHGEAVLLVVTPPPALTVGDRLPYGTLLSQATSWERQNHHLRLEPRT